ncbi:FecR family protein [Variovorax sp. LT1R16]|uniref:FecR family protein n=1 Tax=Variovorax sp. LT1R16 TaxID=3443728 RepID=UPI003F4806F7
MKTPAEDIVPISDELQLQAAAWLRRLTSGDVRPRDAQAFQQWKRISPAHQAAFEEVKRRWQVMKPALGELLRTDPSSAALHRRTLARAGMNAGAGRRAFVGAAVGAAAVAGVAVMRPPLGLWPSAGEWAADYRTATGEQQTLAFTEHVSVMLNTRTSIRRELKEHRTTGLQLVAGEVAIDLQNSDLAFVVAAGAGRSTFGSGRLEVRDIEGNVCVTCIDGVVRVEHPSGTRALHSGQQVIYDAAGIGRVTQTDPDNVSAWRKGELVFKDVPLGRVIDEINRYRSGRVMLANSSAGKSAVSGRFYVESLDTALSQLQHSFNLKARWLPAGVVILS